MTDEPSYTINDFCALEKLSRSQLYKLWHQGKGPRTYKIGNRPRISPEARREWRQDLEAAATKLSVPRTSTSEAA
jgi:predicted DNA-binding transcriptional regulator AlpA